jgi:kumamolisin
MSVIPGSERKPVADRENLKPYDPGETFSVTVHVRRQNQADLDAIVAARGQLSPEEFYQRFSASEQDIAALRSFAEQNGLMVERAEPRSRSVLLSGTAEKMAQAFQVNLGKYQHAGKTYRIREGSIQVPDNLAGVVTGVFGFDTRPVAKPRLVAHRHVTPTTTSFNATQLASLYNFPSGNGSGEGIAVIELGGGFNVSDLSTYFYNLGISPVPSVTAVGVDGATNSPTGDPNGPDGEVELDIEISAAIAPAATIKAYFGPNTNQGFLDAVTAAVNDSSITLLSISWGAPEADWTASAMTSFDQEFQAAGVLGRTVFVASGDNGSSDGLPGNNVDFPASSPHAVGCGGTTITVSGNSITSEVVWNSDGGASGGGVSNVFPKPSYQANVNVPAPTTSSGGRGVPDVAGDADPNSGYNVVVDGTSTAFGGTSCVAPLYAGLFARINSALVASGKPRVGFVNAALYADEIDFNDITSGNNGAFSASVGWNPCTGLGSPKGTALLTALGGTPAPDFAFIRK